MTTSLTNPATAGSTYVVTINFLDEEENNVAPETMKWTLLDDGGEIINDRNQVVVSPSESVDIVLSGADLPENTGLVKLVVEGTYNSIHGIGLPYRDAVEIIINLP